MTKGKLIVFEGIDGCGKSTQAKILAAWLEKQRIAHYLTKEPRTPFRELIFSGRFSNISQGLLFFIDHYEHAKVVDDWIHQGFNIISDRWLYSQYAYNAVKPEPQIDATRLYEKYELLQIQPDIVLQLELDPEVATKRAQGRPEKAVSQADKSWAQKHDFNKTLQMEYRRIRMKYSAERWKTLRIRETDTEGEIFSQLVRPLVEKLLEETE